MNAAFICIFSERAEENFSESSRKKFIAAKEDFPAAVQIFRTCAYYLKTLLLSIKLCILVLWKASLTTKKKSALGGISNGSP